MPEIEPQPGEIWEIGGFGGAGELRQGYGQISKHYRRWEELNGKQVRILKKDTDPFSRCSKWPFVVLETDAECTGISRGYFKRRIKEAPKTTQRSCCRPSVSLCDNCSVEFVREMVDKGKKYNRWTRMWT